VSGIILVAAALGLSNFAAAIGIGLSGVDGRLRIRVAIIFGFFETVMPLFGLLIGQRVAGSIVSRLVLGRWISCVPFSMTLSVGSRTQLFGVWIERSIYTMFVLILDP